jgi:MOSC domain-containing protein YiiM
LRTKRHGFAWIFTDVRTGDAVELLAREENRVSVAGIVQLYVADYPDPDLLRQAAGLAALPANWRDYFLQRLQQAS